ncbi:hypothetical protein [Helicobacter pullorum]|uniref:hypothetical protein n=1 Tax=Helicobacter pullorum TaxID=35818 RepID=UPI001FCFF0AC|nr:hypothetical protein [Helicobacter pullorum]
MLSIHCQSVTRLCLAVDRKFQKMARGVEVAIKRARQMALIPYIVDRKNVVENPFKI